MNNNCLYIGTYGNVACIDQNSGKELWRTALTGSGFAPVTIYLEDGKLYCGCNGKVYFVCATTGKVLAKNDMVGQGFGVVTFTTKKSENKSEQNVPQIPQPQPIPQHLVPQYIIQQPPMMPQPIFVQSPQPQQMINGEQPIFIQQQPQSFVQPQNEQIQQPIFMQQQMTQPVSNPMNLPMMIPQPQFQTLQHQFSQSIDIEDHLQNDEEYARLLDMELNGNQQENRRNNNNNNVRQNIQMNQFVANNIQQTFVQKIVSIDDIIFVGLNSFVTALNKHTAQEVWRAYIPTGYGVPLSIIFSKDKIIVASCGHVYGFNAYNGKELWKNNLPGLRYSFVSVVSSTNNNNAHQYNSGYLSHYHN